MRLFVGDAVPIIAAFVLQHTVSGLCEAESLISPEALRWIQLLPAINDGAAKHANQFYWFPLAFVSSHASSPPILCRLLWLSGNVSSRILTEITTFQLC